jgi:hypothetical protein
MVCSKPSAPWNRTSRLSGKYRKKVLAVSPARSAISATVVCSYPISTNSSNAALRSRAYGIGVSPSVPSGSSQSVDTV